MVVKPMRKNQRNFWADVDFVEELNTIRHLASARTKKDLTYSDVTRLIIRHPAFKDIKKEITENPNKILSGVVEIPELGWRLKLNMDRRRKPL